VAAALEFGTLGADEVEAPKLADPRVRRLLSVMTVAEDAEFSRRFPAERWARVRIALRDGREVVSEPAIARGNPENPLTDAEIREKFHALAAPVLGDAAAQRIERAIDALGDGGGALPALLDAILERVATPV
jgi:2-methylcitrate dehydratase PrpD